MTATDLKAAVVVITMGDRNDDVLALDRSLMTDPRWAGDDADRVLVINSDAAPPSDLDARWTVVQVGENLGIPGGRNVGIEAAWDTGEPDIVILLDDDAANRTPELIGDCLQRFASEPDLGVVGFRIVVNGTMRSLRRWNPRIGGGRADETGDVTAFLGGGHAFRVSAFRELDGYCAEFFYGLEETDIAWRFLDAGWRISYDADLVIEHPETVDTRHPQAVFQIARNRTWLARRQLPQPLAVAYVALWATITLARSRSVDEVKEVGRGIREGLRSLPGSRSPMQWSTALTMTRLGRPPLL